MPMFATYRERYEYLKNSRRIKALRDCFALSLTVLPIDSYDEILDLVTEATLYEDDVALLFVHDELKKCRRELRKTVASANEEMMQIQQKRFDPLIEAISKELQLVIPTLLLVRLEKDAPLRACVGTITRYPGATTAQLCRTLHLSTAEWQRCGHNLSILGIAKCHKASWRLTPFGERVLKEFQEKRLLAEQAPDALLP